MCGIFCFISKTNSIEFGECVLQQCQHLLSNRGPDNVGTVTFDNRVLMCATVLWQQGSEITTQPVESDRFVLLFNGDLFIERGELSASDTQWLLEEIASAVTCLDDLANVFKGLKGPFSLILLDKCLRRVYFARDSLGRNSLLLGQSDEGFTIASVTGNTQMDVVEIPPSGIYYIDLNSDVNTINMLPWKRSENDDISPLNVNQKFLELPWMVKDEREIYFNYHQILHHTSSEGELFDYLLSNTIVAGLCDRLLKILGESVEERVLNTPSHCKQCMASKTSCKHSRVGVLFSGGIDCTILALLADRFVSSDVPICLLNVAFEKIIRPGNPNFKKADSTSSTEIDWDVPDRITGRSTWKELQQLRPAREWHFVEINVTRKELQNYKDRISNLVFPLKSVLDESLGAALWFASRGEGLVNNSYYKSTCRVMLLGSGADELFGGYSRHRVAFNRSFASKDSQPTEEEIQTGFSNLMTELDLDWNRLPSRNLARDDRIIGDHGVTPRTPYLQEDFISLVQSLEAEQRCYHPLGEGIGDKLTLRLCGYRLGLRTSATLRKRALQFGSRIADRKQNANDKSSFLGT
ncbi:asparagine synthetase domain-containing protein CG17486 [Aedes albopictus]|uniref:Glutamine amidotransferase type-2 domain-containing protein n=1 Tax=Aedes albopictus TaxID=7160 RepID=A0ABM1XP15_AEDAL